MCMTMGLSQWTLIPPENLAPLKMKTISLFLFLNRRRSELMDIFPFRAGLCKFLVQLFTKWAQIHQGFHLILFLGSSWWYVFAEQSLLNSWQKPCNSKCILNSSVSLYDSEVVKLGGLFLPFEGEYCTIILCTYLLSICLENKTTCHFDIQESAIKSLLLCLNAYTQLL